MAFMDAFKKYKPTNMYGTNVSGKAVNQMGDALKTYGLPKTRTSPTTKSFSSGYSSGYSAFSAPNTAPIDPAEALKRALARVNPLRDQARTNEGVINQQQMGLLRQKLNQSGQLSGAGMVPAGAEIQANMDMSNALQQRLAQTDQSYDTQAQDLADRIRSQDAAEKAQLFQQALASWQAGRGAFESDRGFGYQQGRDQIGDERYKESWDREGLWHDQDMTRQGGLDAMLKRIQLGGLTGIDPVTGKPTFDREQFTAQNALANRREARIGSGDGGGGKTNSRSNTVGAIKGTLAEAKGYEEGIQAGATYEDLMTDFNENKNYWAKLGYDLNAILDVISKAPRAGQKYGFGG